MKILKSTTRPNQSIFKPISVGIEVVNPVRTKVFNIIAFLIASTLKIAFL
jgi:hypothetical protein